MKSLGLVLAFIREFDDEGYIGGSCEAANTARPTEFPTYMPSDSSLGQALAFTRQLLAETDDAPPRQVAATTTVQPNRNLAAHVTALTAAI